MMGVWFLATSVGNFIGGRLAAFYESMPLAELFGAVARVRRSPAGFVMLRRSSRRLTIEAESRRRS